MKIVERKNSRIFTDDFMQFGFVLNRIKRLIFCW